jgi:hypothetical protein
MAGAPFFVSERDEQIAALEQRIRRRPPMGVSAPVAGLAVVLALAAIWIFERRDWAYFFSPAEPVSLGREGEYRWDLLESNRYAQVHGAPTARGLYAKESGGVMVVVGLRDTPVLVRRRALPGEEWAPDKGTPPQPDQRPFAVAGRLLRVEDAPAWAREAANQLGKGDEVRPVEGKMWILLSGARPRSDPGLLLVTALLLTFAALNGYFLVRDLRHRLRR